MSTMYLDAGFIDVRITPTDAVTSLAKDDYFLEQKNTTNTFLTAIVHGKLSLTQQHALLL